MLFSNPRKLLAEAAADMLDPKESKEVKDVVDELEDILTNNVEEVPEKDKLTNGGIPVTTESVALMESAGANGTRYLISFDNLCAVMESEAETAAEEAAEGAAPTPEEVEAATPEPKDVVTDIAEKNGVDPDQVTIMIKAESMKCIARGALLEAKAGACAENTKAVNKAKKVLTQCKESGLHLALC